MQDVILQIVTPKIYSSFFDKTNTYETSCISNAAALLLFRNLFLLNPSIHMQPPVPDSQLLAHLQA
jgi:hypothetical protein